MHRIIIWVYYTFPAVPANTGSNKKPLQNVWTSLPFSVAWVRVWRYMINSFFRPHIKHGNICYSGHYHPHPAKKTNKKNKQKKQLKHKRNRGAFGNSNHISCELKCQRWKTDTEFTLSGKEWIGGVRVIHHPLWLLKLSQLLRWRSVGQ